MADFTIHLAGEGDLDDCAALRAALWPDEDAAAHRAELADDIPSPDRLALIARATDGSAAGIAEASIRRDYVNGCDTSPVGFLEGLFVAPAFRRRGIAAALVERVMAWAREKGLNELASDALIDNAASHALHARLGFAETERVVYFRMPLCPTDIQIG